VVGCCHGCLSSEAWCRFAYGPSNLTATYCLLLREIQIGFGFTFLVPAQSHPGSPRQNRESHEMVVVVVVPVVVVVMSLEKLIVWIIAN